jgi:hypothetical protein
MGGIAKSSANFRVPHARGGCPSPLGTWETSPTRSHDRVPHISILRCGIAISHMSASHPERAANAASRRTCICFSRTNHHASVPHPFVCCRERMGGIAKTFANFAATTGRSGIHPGHPIPSRLSKNQSTRRAPAVAPDQGRSRGPWISFPPCAGIASLNQLSGLRIELNTIGAGFSCDSIGARADNLWMNLDKSVY